MPSLGQTVAKFCWTIFCSLLLLFAVGFSLVTLTSCTIQEESPAGALRWRRGSLEHYPDGSLKKGNLAEPAEVFGHPAKRWVHFHENGKLRGLQLSEDWTWDERQLPAGTFLWFDSDQQLENCWLARDTTIEGLPCRGGGKASTAFFPDGSLRAVFLAEDSRIDGTLCKASIWIPVQFHESGKLAGCQLAEETTVGAVTHPAATHLEFDHDGHATVKDPK